MWQTIPSSDLRSRLGEVKQEAKVEPVVITDSGSTNYLFMSEEGYEKQKQRVAEEAAYAERMARGIRRARNGIKRGECVVGAEEAIRAAERLRATYG